MITSNGNIELNSAQQKDKFIVVGGKENLVVDSRGKVYPMGGVAPAVAPTAKVITGGGSLTPGIGYSYAYTYGIARTCSGRTCTDAFFGRQRQWFGLR